MIENFIKEGKLLIPEEEIDNVYFWTRVSNTQEILLSSVRLFDFLVHSFNKEAETVKNVLGANYPDVKTTRYLFQDYLTFTLNDYKMFNDTTCFCYTSNKEIFNSLICFMAQKYKKYDPEIDSIASLIINKIDESTRFSEVMDKDFIILQDFNALPEHKYRGAIFDAFLSRRCKPNLITLCYVEKLNYIIDNKLITAERAKSRKFIGLNALSDVFQKRRSASKQFLMSEWYSLIKPNMVSNFVYSKETPQVCVRQVGGNR